MDADEQDETLGSLQVRFRGSSFGIKWLISAGIVALTGVFFLLEATDITEKFFGIEGTSHFVRIAGGVMLVFALLMSAMGTFLITEWFEVRSKGVRYGSILGTKEIRWRDMGRIHVHKLTYVSTGRGRRSFFSVTIDSDEGRIYLGSRFLEAVSPLAVIQMLKLHNERALTGDIDDIPMPKGKRPKLEDDELPTKKAKRPKKSTTAVGDSGTGVYQEVCDRLVRGVPATEVEAWLKRQGASDAAASALVDKALADELSAEKRAAEKADKDPLAQARLQLANGEKPERVLRDLKMRGFSDEMANAWLENLRQERL